LFKEAWVEFEKKKDAKQTAALLNGTQIGGSKKSAFYTYLWSMKYLKHFKWQNLTEEVKHKKRLSHGFFAKSSIFVKFLPFSILIPQ
jgi:hypothetical protein